MLEQRKVQDEQREVGARAWRVGLAVHVKAFGLDPEGSEEPMKGKIWPRSALTILKRMHFVQSWG